MFSPAPVCLFVCLSVNRINKNYWSIFVKFYRMDWLDIIEEPIDWVTWTEGHGYWVRRSKSPLRITHFWIQFCHRESRHFLLLFSSLNNAKYDYAVGLTVWVMRRSQRSEGSDHNEINYNSLKCNLGLYILLNKYNSEFRRMYWRRASIQDGQSSSNVWWRHCSETVFPR